MQRLIACALALAAACGSGGGDKKSDEGSGKPAPSEPTADARPARPEPPMPLGVAEVSDFNFPYGKGEKAFDKVTKAVKKKDWAAARDAAREAISADPGHLDAQWQLARALIALGDHAGAVQPLTVALSGDYLAYAADLVPGDKTMGPFLSSDAGRKFGPTLELIGKEYTERARSGVFVVARRSTFKVPSPSAKPQWASTRAELYSYDQASQRYLRITHTDHQLAGWMTAPSNDQLVYVAWSEVKTGAGDADPTQITRWKLGLVKLDTLAAVGEASLKQAARRARVHYAAGDELWFTLYPPSGRWGVGDGTGYVLDQATMKLKKSKSLAPAADGTTALEVDFDRVALDTPAPADIQAEPQATSFRILTSNTTVSLPSGELVGEDGYVWSPNKDHLVVRTMPQPCAGNPESVLYLVDASTGKLKNILRADSRFGVRWIDNDHFVYEDDAGALRLYDAEVRTQMAQWKARGGLALTGLGAATGSVCMDAPPEGAEGPPPGGGGSAAPVDPMPPEEE